VAFRRFILICLAGAVAVAGCDAPEQTGATSAETSAGDEVDPGVAASGLPTEKMTIGGETFTIELAHEPEAIVKGLGERRSLDPRGGMLFIFPRPSYRQFVMRDCYIPIDIAFLDSRGVVLSKYTMDVEPAQREGETPMAYERRLKKYPSRYKTLFVLETAGGTWDALGVEVGDQIGFDAEALKKLAY